MKKGRKIVQSKKTVYNGTLYQSSLEASMHRMLDEAGIRAHYESKSYEILSGLVYEGECYERARKDSKDMMDRRKVLKTSYTPDFIGVNEEFIIECKGRANESFPIRWKLFKTKMMERENPPIIFKPTNLKDCKQVVEILTKKGYGKSKDNI